MPFASKGFPEAAGDILARTMAVLGEGTVVVDNSSCAFTMRADGQGRVMDVVDFAHDVLMPRLRIRPVGEAVAVHPVCSLVKAGGAEKLLALARACAVKAEVPEGAGCCGTAGDRGLMYPELPAAAMGAEKLDRYTMFCSSNRMCEVGMTEATGKSFGTFLALLERASRAPR
jgi:D-lactate dehydrogenase